MAGQSTVAHTGARYRTRLLVDSIELISENSTFLFHSLVFTHSSSGVFYASHPEYKLFDHVVILTFIVKEIFDYGSFRKLQPVT